MDICALQQAAKGPGWLVRSARVGRCGACLAECGGPPGKLVEQGLGVTGGVGVGERRHRHRVEFVVRPWPALTPGPGLCRGGRSSARWGTGWGQVLSL